MDRMLKIGQKMFGVVAGIALLLGVLAVPIGEVKADPTSINVGGQCPGKIKVVDNRNVYDGCVNPGAQCKYFDQNSSCADNVGNTACQCPPV
jgi:hypothetical protein